MASFSRRTFERRAFLTAFAHPSKNPHYYLDIEIKFEVPKIVRPASPAKRVEKYSNYFCKNQKYPVAVSFWH